MLGEPPAVLAALTVRYDADMMMVLEYTKNRFKRECRTVDRFSSY